VNLADVIADSIDTVPDRVALICDEEEIPYRRIGEAVSRAAAGLHAGGVRRGDRVALADTCGVLAVATVLGAARIGAAAAPMSPALTALEMAELCRSARCGLVGVAGDDARDRLGRALGNSALGARDVLAGTHADLPSHAAKDDDVALVLFTGGTTGAAKPIPMTHGTLARRVRSFAQPVDSAASPAVALMCVPFNHVAGLVGVLVGLAGGTTSVIQRRFDAGEWLRLASEHRVSRAFLVPTMLHRIVTHPDFATADLSGLAMITYGAAPAAPGLIERAVETLPWVSFVNVFGQTETLGAVTALGPEEHRAGRIGSVGRPLPGVEVRIVDPSKETEAGPGETGELWVLAAHTTSPGWVRTGDLVWRDEDGYLYPAGRLTDVINRGGEKVSPAEVEAVLLAHPSVAHAAVTGVADPEMGERIAAAVVLREPLDAADLAAWCRERLAQYKIPERILFTEELPATELGKVSRPALRRLFEDM
jgi:long-chain acyl-CoA synthetase